MNEKQILVAGPYCGEFGWELFSWQAYVRRMAKQYDETIVCSATNHEALYSDFVTRYIPFDATGIKDCWWLANATQTVKDKQNEIRHLGTKLLIPHAAIKIWDQDFIKFGTAGIEPKFDVLMHARMPIGRRPYHSWHVDNWARLRLRLREEGLKLACIGTEAFDVPGTTDMRNIPLGRLMDLMASASLVVGPSSGPMHLASLCGTPHFVWTDNAVYQAIGANNKRRYMDLWNPLKTSCRIFDSFGWNPPVAEVADAVLSYFYSLKATRSAEQIHKAEEPPCQQPPPLTQ